jgi:hypothetical protein
MATEPISAADFVRLGFRLADISTPDFQLFQLRLDSGCRVDARLWDNGHATIRASFPPFSGYVTNRIDLLRQVQFIEGHRVKLP